MHALALAREIVAHAQAHGVNFIDTADVGEIQKAIDLGLCDGVTTNPSLVAKTGRSFEDVLKEIVALKPGPISAEVTAVDCDGMLREAAELVKFGPDIVIKIPLITEGLRAVKTLSADAVAQSMADGMAKAGGKSTQLPLPASAFGNPTAVAQAVKAALQKDKTVDGIITISAGDATSAATGIAQAEKLVIKGSDTLGAKMVPQVAEAFRAKNPGVVFEIAAEELGRLLVHSRELDVLLEAGGFPVASDGTMPSERSRPVSRSYTWYSRLLLIPSFWAWGSAVRKSPCEATLGMPRRSGASSKQGRSSCTSDAQCNSSSAAAAARTLT